MAIQCNKTSHNGWVDFTRGIVELPDPRPKSPAAKPACDLGRLDPRRLILAGFPTALLAIAAAPALAGPVSSTVLTDGNGTATISPGSGVTGLTVDGVSQLALDEFFYQAGNGSIVPITPSTKTSTGVPPNIGTFTYSDADIAATIGYILSGGAPGDPVSLDESLTLTNSTANPLAVKVYKYSDFDLGGQSANQSASGSDTPVDTIDQFSSDGFTASDSVGQGNTAAPTAYEITNSSALLTSLQNSTLTGLNNTTSGPGNINWAFEFDDSLAANGHTGDTLSISLNNTVSVPEPADLFAALAGGGLLMRRRRSASRPQ